MVGQHPRASGHLYAGHRRFGAPLPSHPLSKGGRTENFLRLKVLRQLEVLRLASLKTSSLKTSSLKTSSLKHVTSDRLLMVSEPTHNCWVDTRLLPTVYLHQVSLLPLWSSWVKDLYLWCWSQESSRQFVPLCCPFGLWRKAANFLPSLGGLPCCREQAFDQDFCYRCLSPSNSCPSLSRSKGQQNAFVCRSRLFVKWYASLLRKAHWCCRLCRYWTNLSPCPFQWFPRAARHWSDSTWKIQVCRTSKDFEITQVGTHQVSTTEKLMSTCVALENWRPMETLSRCTPVVGLSPSLPCIKLDKSKPS